MRLPNADQARIERAKTADYLLSTDHPHGRDKAAAFLRFGFSPERWEKFTERFTTLPARRSRRMASSTSSRVY